MEEVAMRTESRSRAASEVEMLVRRWRPFGYGGEEGVGSCLEGTTLGHSVGRDVENQWGGVGGGDSGACILGQVD